MRSLYVAAFTTAILLTGCGGAGGGSSNSPDSNYYGGSDHGGSSSDDPSAPPVATGDDTGSETSPSDVPGGGQGTLEPGTLTAADWDDNLNLDFYLDFLATVAEQGASLDMKVLPAADRIAIRVVDGQGVPARDATLAIRDGDTHAPLKSLVTGSDGRTLYFPSLDGAATTFEVEVALAGQSITKSFAAAETVWAIAVPAVATPTPALDLAIVIDNTGSMYDETDYLQAELSWVVSQVSESNPGLRLRFALVAYRDEGDEFVVRTNEFTSDLSEMLGWVSALEANGGGDYPESVAEALDAAMHLSWSSDDAVRVAFWIGDAPPQAERQLQTADAAILARAKAIRVYPVAASGVDTTAEWAMRQVAEFTSSRYIFLTDDSGVGGEHAEPHIPCYLVQKLNMLMVRVLQSEVAGGWLYPTADQIIRTAGSPTDGVCVVDGNTYYY